MKREFSVFVSIMCLMLGQTYAQNFYSKKNEFPPKLLSGNSLIVINNMESLFTGGTTKKSFSKGTELADGIHKLLISVGINPKVYVLYSDLSDPVKSKDMMSQLKSYSLDNVVLFSKNTLMQYTYYSLMIGELDPSQSDFNIPLDTYKATINSMSKEDLEKDFAKAMKKAKLEKAQHETTYAPNILTSQAEAPRGEVIKKLPKITTNNLYFPKYWDGIYDDSKDSTVRKRYKKADESLRKIGDSTHKEVVRLADSLGFNVIIIDYEQYLPKDSIDDESAFYLLTETDRAKIKDWEASTSFIHSKMDMLYRHVCYFLENTSSHDRYYVNYGEYKNPRESYIQFLVELKKASSGEAGDN